MTCAPAHTGKSLGLVIDLDTCVGCQGCVTACKEWNAGGHMAPLTDINPYGGGPDGVWFNRVHTYEHAT
jgi:Fe-S-cluster-containing dehydrogenase component